MKNNIDTIYILGLGALGGIYAAKLHNLNPTCVTIIADEKRAASLQQSRVSINGKAYSFKYISPGDQSQPKADLVIVAVKYPQLEQAILDMRGFIGDSTVVISLLNGISSEEIIGRTIGMEHLLYAYGVGMDAGRTGNSITYANMGRIIFGEKDNRELSERVKAVKNIFERAGIPHQIPTDMYKALWAKFMMNTGVNQASAVLKAPYGLFQQNKEARWLMFAAAEEVVLLSQKIGINLDKTDLDEFGRILDTLSPTGKTSMLQDIEAGRKSEVDIFAGTVIELGKKHDIPTPVNETLFSIINVMELQNK